MPLREGEWNLSYSANGVFPGADFTFGTIASGYYLLEPYEITYAEGDAGDTPMPQEDGVRFGRDYRAPATITFEVGVDTVDDAPTQLGRHNANLGAVSTMLEAWDAEAVRRRFATPAVLRTTQGGRARRFYGRPRKPAPAGSKLTKQGYTPVVCTFACVDSKAYDDVEQIARANIVPPDHYGLVGPLTTPLTMTAESASKNAGEVVVGGTKPTWPVITIYGPISNPVCEVVGRWKAGLDLTLGVGERVVIDPRPWVRTVMRNGNASVAGRLTRGTPQLKDMRLPRGRQDFVLRGTDATGNAYMTVAWRDAYAYL
ncbi:hypothetical protein [Streptomyces sp. SudanB91_2054]|uniref:hypothetical protein n=1 Tax=Streptomyces sp. SudanB91_2054 TaxID=3035278 RepID=UPI0036DCEFDF